LKGSTWKFTWNGLQIPCIGIYSGLFVINLVFGSWMHEKYSLSRVQQTSISILQWSQLPEKGPYLIQHTQAHWSSSMAPKMSQGSSDSPKHSCTKSGEPDIKQKWTYNQRVRSSYLQWRVDWSELQGETRLWCPHSTASFAHPFSPPAQTWCRTDEG
jgi:hypothetical protein